MKSSIKLFEEKKVRALWNETEEEWYFSVMDVVEVLTESPVPRKYWRVMKTRLKQEGEEPTTICSQLKMLAPDGKIRLTNVELVSITNRLKMLSIENKQENKDTN
jgi:hypothetical protein